jgi:glycosyltransferase involved in cell wall biosynthesis
MPLDKAALMRMQQWISQNSGRCLGYLSGAPRVSTDPDAAAGGPRAHVLGVIGGFESLGWEVRRFIAGDAAPRFVQHAGEERLTGSWPKRAALDLGRLTYRHSNRRKALKVVGTQVDWVYERFASFQALGEPFQRAGVPWILETQAPFWLEAQRDRRSLALTGLARRLELAAYRDCNVLVCVTETLKVILVREGGLDPEKVLVVPNGVDLDQFNPERVIAVRNFRTPTLIFAGALLQWQRLDLLIDAFGDLASESGGTPPFKLVILGDGPERGALDARIRDRALTDDVRMLGRVPMHEVPGHMLGADLGFLGHVRREGGAPYHSPLKLYEYMAMGLPVLAGRTPETERIVREGRTGFLFDPGNLDDLRRALARASERVGALDEMGAAAREAAAMHGWTRRVEDMIDGIRGIVGAA